jgi:hypothetical protein
MVAFQKYVHYMMVPGTILAPLMLLTFLMVMFARGRRIPQCVSCGALKVRSTRPVGFLDSIAGLFLIRPHRCEGCRSRFYAMRWTAINPPQKRVIWIVFQFRNRWLHRVVIRRVKVCTRLRSADRERSVVAAPSGLMHV